MNKNQLGNSDIEISELTFGCMSLGTNQKQATYMIDYALDSGVNHLDTADLYDFGKNEEIVGEAIKHKRQEVILTSKVGNHFSKDTKDWFWDPSKEHILNGLKDSLRRLQTDYIDFYMLHGGTIEDPIDESIEAFEQLKKEGYIRAYGISSIRPNVIREYVSNSTIDAVMMQYSLLDRRPESEVLDLLHKHNISVLARGPLAKGMLSNRAKEQIDTKGQEGYLEYTYSELKEIYNKLSTFTDHEQSLNAIALKYVLKHPAVTSAVFGASNVEQLRENIDKDPSSDISDSFYQELKQITKAMNYKQHL
ncbi:aldo/keto reductase [Ornithinibacillus sp. L9]|uniref:Aldo/keto reductase n=1 Tax=Ornithinibacillus caprae TaxID=2678566 RepID=A0A6N8FCW0_9BACI|nr:aldo/keto reductase [Ornithinibacillus caprae]MUK87205.1 aldo/keto reductase [Ornithinibacillus caprae]